MTYLLSSFRSFARHHCAVAAIEFAFIFPLVLSIFLGTVEITRALIISRKTAIAADMIGEMVSSETFEVTKDDVTFAQATAAIIIPQAIADGLLQNKDWQNIVQVGVTSVLFTPTQASCTQNCTYSAKVAWSSGLITRACGQLSSMSDTSQTSLSSIPASLFGPNSAIVADVAYQYQSLFVGSILPNMTLMRSAYFRPRYVKSIPYTDNASTPSVLSLCN